MKTLGFMTVAVCLLGATVSCRDISFTMGNYKKAIRSGYKSIPQALQIEEVLGDSDHFISYHGSLELGNEWQTEVFFRGRYSLTMEVPVKMDRSFDKVLAVAGPPTFYLLEISSVSDDGREARFNRDGERRFTAEESAKVYKANGDFSVVGVKLSNAPPVKNFDKYVEQVRKDRVKVRP